MTAYLTPAAIAERWGFSPAHVRRLCASGLLPAMKTSKRGWRVSIETLAAYEAAHTNDTPAPSAAPQQAPQTLTDIYGSATPIFKGPVPWRNEVIQ